MDNFYELIDDKIREIQQKSNNLREMIRKIDSLSNMFSSEEINLSSVRENLGLLDITDVNLNEMLDIIESVGLDLNNPLISEIRKKFIDYCNPLFSAKKKNLSNELKSAFDLEKSVSEYKSITPENIMEYIDKLHKDSIFADEEKVLIYDHLIRMKTKMIIDKHRSQDEKTEKLSILKSNAKHILEKKDANKFDEYYFIIADIKELNPELKNVTKELDEIYVAIKKTLSSDNISYDDFSKLLKQYDEVYEKFKTLYSMEEDKINENKEKMTENKNENEIEPDILIEAKNIIANYDELSESERTSMIDAHITVLKQLVENGAPLSFISENISMLQKTDIDNEVAKKLYARRGDEKHSSQYYKFEDILDEIGIILSKVSELGSDLFNDKLKEDIEVLARYKNKGNSDDITLEECTKARDIIDEFKKDVEISNLTRAVFPEEFSNYLNVGQKSIVIFMTDSNGKYPIYEKMNSIDMGHRSITESRLLRTISSNITQRSYINEISRMGKYYLDVIKGHSGKKYFVRKKDDAKNFKYGNDRLSLYPLAFSERNKKLLAEEYGIPGLESILVVGTFTTTHDIDELGREIASCKDEIVKLEDLFESSTTPIETLKSIIEASSEICNKMYEDNEKLKTRKGA